MAKYNNNNNYSRDRNKHNRNDKDYGMSVEVRNNNVEQAIRKLKKKLMNDGILQELRERQYFISNTEKRLKAEAAARARHRKRIAKDSIEKKRLY
jgi:small subunit ribosomal protein S21